MSVPPEGIVGHANDPLPKVVVPLPRDVLNNEPFKVIVEVAVRKCPVSIVSDFEESMVVVETVRFDVIKV